MFNLFKQSLNLINIIKDIYKITYESNENFKKILATTMIKNVGAYEISNDWKSLICFI